MTSLAKPPAAPRLQEMVGGSEPLPSFPRDEAGCSKQKELGSFMAKHQKVS